MKKDFNNASDEELSRTLPKKWRAPFLRFVKSGEADPAFLQFLDNDKDAQKVVETVFERECKALEGLGRHIRNASDEELSRTLPKKWRAPFLRFVESGEADPAFLEFLGSDKDAQRAADIVFKRQCKALEDLGRHIRAPGNRRP